MLCKGTPSFPTKKIRDDYLDYHGGGCNASTGRGVLSFYGRIIAKNANIMLALKKLTEYTLIIQDSLEMLISIKMELKLLITL